MERAERGVDELGGRESLDEELRVEKCGEESLEGGKVGMGGRGKVGALEDGNGGEEACCGG